MNLGLTFYNKSLLQHYPFPWLMTTLHASSAAIGCLIVRALKGGTTLDFTKKDTLVLVAFSTLFTVNIAISNVSLNMVSVPFHQIARSTTPVAAITIYRMLGREYAVKTYLALIPIIFGVAMSTYGDYYFTLLGASMTFLGVVLAAIKTVVTNRLLTGLLAVPPLELLFCMSPLAAIQSFSIAWLNGEVRDLVNSTAFTQMGLASAAVTMGNGLVAFLLNISSFQTNKLAGALTLTVCGNLKQCLTILLGVFIFDVKVTMLNGVGMAVTLAGAAWYSKVELDVKRPPSS